MASAAFILVETGNHGTGTYTRTINGTGSYDRTVSGPGATVVPTFNDLYAFLGEQTGDPHSGTFSLVRTGTDRYGLLEDFHDVSNTQNGQTPGHMNFYPFGDPFVDPFWADLGHSLVEDFHSLDHAKNALVLYVTGRGDTPRFESEMARAYERGPFGQTERDGQRTGYTEVVDVSIKTALVALLASVGCHFGGVNPILFGGAGGGGGGGGGGGSGAAAETVNIAAAKTLPP